MTPSELARVNRTLRRLGIAPLSPPLPESEELRREAAIRHALASRAPIRRVFGSVIQVR